MPPHQQARDGGTPYTRVLSALRKTKLCVEFRLSTDGSVVGLRNWLKDYLDLHCNTLYRNPRYNGLFPRHRHGNQRAPSLRPSSIASSCHNSPAWSSQSSSWSSSYESWHGIQNQLIPPNEAPPLAVHHHPPAGPHQPSPNLDYIHPEEFYDHPLPPWSPSVTNSDQGLPPPAVYAAEGCKFLFITISFSIYLYEITVILSIIVMTLWSLIWHYAVTLFFLDTMQSAWILWNPHFLFVRDMTSLIICEISHTLIMPWTLCSPPVKQILCYLLCTEYCVGSVNTSFLTCVVIPFFLVFSLSQPVLISDMLIPNPISHHSNYPFYFLVPPVIHDPSHNILPAVPTIPAQNAPIPDSGVMTASWKCPAHVPGLAGTNATFLVPDYIQKKFAEGWNVHVPLTFLTDKGCLTKDKPTAGAAQEILTLDNAGHMQTSSKPLHDDGELDLTFDEWHQAWRRLLELIKSFLPDDFHAWEVHYTFILNRENCAKLWPVYLAYDAKICKRTTHFPIDPSVFSLGIWNDLEQLRKFSIWFN